MRQMHVNILTVPGLIPICHVSLLLYAHESLEANVKAAVAVMSWRWSGASCVEREFEVLGCNAHMWLLCE